MSCLLRGARFHCWVTPSHLGIRSSLRSFSNGVSDPGTCFTVSYLVNSIGLSPKAALSASKQVSFKTSKQPDKAVKLLLGYGFSGANITALVRSHPRVLISNIERSVFPKLEFLKSKGFSWPERAHTVSVFPTLLRRSLDNQIIPAFEFFGSVIRSEKKLISAISRCPDLLAHDVSKYVVPNITILRENGVSDSYVAALVCATPMSVVVSPDKFCQTVEQVIELGFDASTHGFVMAIAALRSMMKTTWEGKVDSLKKRGWSEEDILKAVKNHPQFMRTSLDKIAATMEFFFREMGLSPSDIASCPMVFNLSLEKRLIPRRLVICSLLSKGLLKKEYSLHLVFRTSEKKFLGRFVTPFQTEASELMKLYEDSKLGLSSVSGWVGIKFDEEHASGE